MFGSFGSRATSSEALRWQQKRPKTNNPPGCFIKTLRRGLEGCSKSLIPGKPILLVALVHAAASSSSKT
eukprot:3461022-Pyramimonas_sp.AAC.1